MAATDPAGPIVFLKPPYPTRPTVDFDRMRESSSGDIDQNSGSISLTFGLKNWDDLWTFLEQAAGEVLAVGGPTGQIFMRIPWECPIRKGMFASRLSWTGVGATSPPISGKYGLARVVVTFTNPTFPMDETTWVTTRLSSSTSYMTLPNRYFKFEDLRRAEVGAGIRINQIEIHKTRYRIQRLDRIAGQIFALTDFVNKDPIEDFVPGWTFDPGTLIFQGCETLVTGTSKGMEWQLTLRFMWRRYSWQTLLHPNGTGFKPVLDANGDPPYQESTDLPKLLTI